MSTKLYKTIKTLLMATTLMALPILPYSDPYMKKVVAEGYRSLGDRLAESPAIKSKKEQSSFGKKNILLQRFEQRVEDYKELWQTNAEVKEATNFIFDKHTLYNHSFWALGYNPNTSDTTISLTTLEKMDLIKGSGKKSGESLASRISSMLSTSTPDHPQGKRETLFFTQAGRFSMIKKISQPYATATVPLQNQHIIKSFASNKKLHDSVRKIFQKIGGKTEISFLAYYNHSVLLSPHTTRDLYSTMYPFNKFNGSYHYLTLKAFFDRFLKLHNITWALLLSYSISQIYKKTSEELTTKEKSALENTFILNYFMSTLLSLKNMMTKQYVFMLESCGYDSDNNPHPLLAAIPIPPKEILASIGLGICADQIAQQIISIKKQEELYQFLQSELINVATYINGAKELYNIICLYPEVAQNFTSLKALENLVNPTGHHSAEFKELIKLLDTKTFTGKASFFSTTGRILRAHTLMQMDSVQTEFIDIVNAIGELDIYLVLAHKINMSAKNAPYSFVTFDTESKKPYIKAIDIWNPFIPENKAVVNTLELGLTKPRNVILSGPNTGGKSTISKAVLLNTILAQTFGIVAAKNMTMTPFANLDCYLNMTDDTADGVSGLKAEVQRAQAIIQKIRETVGFSFILLDEIFTATSPDQAEKLAINFISRLSEFANTIFINAAHFDGIMHFAENSPNCKNYHMGAVLNANRSVSRYTYKLNEGRSHIKNAAQVAQEAFSFDF